MLRLLNFQNKFPLGDFSEISFNFQFVFDLLLIVYDFLHYNILL